MIKPNVHFSTSKSRAKCAGMKYDSTECQAGQRWQTEQQGRSRYHVQPPAVAAEEAVEVKGIGVVIDANDADSVAETGIVAAAAEHGERERQREEGDGEDNTHSGVVAVPNSYR